MTEHEPTPNVPLIAKTIDHILSHPEEWEQASWRCDLRAELTDTMGDREDDLAHGYGALPDIDDEITALRAKLAANPCGTTYCYAGHAAVLAGYHFAEDSDCLVDTDQGVRHVQHVAREELGLTVPQADTLFYGSNTLDDLTALLYHYTGGEVDRRWT